MYDYFFTFRTVTSAQSAAKTLTRAGIRNAMARTARQVQQMGCGYSIRVSANNYNAAKDALRHAGDRFSKIYMKLPDGSWREV
ncbi:MAG: DUF3343 domain-containing protein [Oscillospiraceae bacterium]|jgi:hypothetical protein|nr:DUF3343 domain-containing protein [Oscillospiraceae bacterium]